MRRMRAAPGQASVRPARTTRRHHAKKSRVSVAEPPSRNNAKWGKNQTALAAPAEPKRPMKWGLQDKSENQPVNQIQPQVAERTPPKQPMRWGKTDKPSIVGAEPGMSHATQSAARVETASEPLAETKTPAKKFQWGSN